MQGAHRDRALCVAAPGLGRARCGGLLADAVRRLSAAVAGVAGRTRCGRRRGPDHPAANDGQRGSRRRSRCGRPSCGSTSGAPRDCRRSAGLWALVFRAVRMAETVAYFQAEAEANWLRTHQPEIWDKTHKYLFLSGFLTYRLTGRFVDSVGCQVGYVPFDYKRLRWARARTGSGAPLGIEARHVARAGAARRRLSGAIIRRGCRATGLPEGLPVIAAAADKACEVHRRGLPGAAHRLFELRDDRHRSTPPTAVTSKPMPLLPPYPAAVPEPTLEVQIYRGYWMVSWFKRGVRPTASGASRERSRDEAGELCSTSWSTRCPPGSMGLMLQPYWSPGAQDARGRRPKAPSSGSATCTPARHLYRAILEGLAYALREGKERTRATQRRADDRPAGRRRRLPERRGHADHGRRLRPAGRPPAPVRDLRARRRHRRRRGPGAASRLSDRRARDDPGRPGLRPRSRAIGASTTRSTARSTSKCTGVSSPCTRRSGTSPAIRPPCADSVRSPGGRLIAGGGPRAR